MASLPFIEIWFRDSDDTYAWRLGGAGKLDVGVFPTNAWEHYDEIDLADAREEAGEYLDGERLEALVASAERRLASHAAGRRRAAEQRAAQYTGLTDEARAEIVEKLIAQEAGAH